MRVRSQLAHAIDPLRGAPALLAAAMVFGGCGFSEGGGPLDPVSGPPTIVAQPSDASVQEGDEASFSVIAAGTGPLFFQWKRAGVPIAGATESTYFTGPLVRRDDQVGFSVQVGNYVGAVESRSAILSIRTAPLIPGEPLSRATRGGVPATFSVTLAAAGTQYEWNRDQVLIPGANGPSYTVGVPLAGDDGAVYTVLAYNEIGSTLSRDATLSVDIGPGLRPTSYANAKGRNAGSVTIPDAWLGRAFGDFFGSGNDDLFVATSVYSSSEAADLATRGEFQFWRWTGSSYVQEGGAVSGDVGCVHPRKAAVADFNGDATPDLFLACHGYDAAPFPGEPSYVLLSQPGGGWVSTAVGTPGFYHSATALDVTGDGHIDVVATNNFASPSVFTFVNDGGGNFASRTDLLPFGEGAYFTVEAADVNGDGRPDLLAGGHDWEGAETVIALADTLGAFAATPMVLPRVENEGVVLDFIVLDADRDGVTEIYVLRTSGGDGTLYAGRTVQRVSWPSLADTVLLSERGVPWVPFLLPVFANGQYSLVGDLDQPAFALILP